MYNFCTASSTLLAKIEKSEGWNRDGIIMEATKIENLLALIEQWTRAEIIARFGYLVGDVDYTRIQIEKKDEIRELLYGTADLVILGEKWNLLKNERERIKKSNKENLKQQFQKLQKELDAMLK